MFNYQALCVVVAILMLAVCASPSPAMMGAETRSVSVDGADFTVCIRGTRAEAIRTNVMPFPSIGAIFARAERAMEIASGCDVITNSMRGDQAVIRADLACS